MLPGIRWGSLRTKITAWFFIPTAIILVAVALVTFYAYQLETERQAIESGRELTGLAASQLATELADRKDYLGGLARAIHVHLMDTPNQPLISNALRRAGNHQLVFNGGLVVLDRNGTIVATEPERPGLVGRSWADRDYFRQMTRTQKRTLSDVVTDGVNGAPVIALSVPVTSNQGELLGALIGMVRLSRDVLSPFYAPLVDFGVDISGNTYLVDRQGYVIYHSDQRLTGANLSNQMVVQRVMARQNDALRTRGPDGTEIVASFAPVPGTSWGLITEENWEELTRDSLRYQQFLLLLLLLGVIVPAVVVTIGIQRIMQPIEALIDGAKQVAQGNFGHSITAHTGDELETLAHQFNRMSAQLQESYDHLEQRVAERTRALAILNAIVTVVNSSLDLQETLDLSLTETLGLLHMEAGAIHFYEPAHEQLLIQVHQGLSERYVAALTRCPVTDILPHENFLTAEPIIVPDLNAEPTAYALARAENLQALAIFPLRAKEEFLGTFTLATWHGPRHFPREERELLRAISDQVGVAIENARLYEQQFERRREAEQRRQVAESLRDVLTVLNSNRSLTEILDHITNQTKRLLGTDVVAIYRLDTEDNLLKIQAARGLPPDYIAHMTIPLGQGIVGRAAQSREPVALSHLDVMQHDEIFSNTTTQPLIDYLQSHCRAILGVPLIIKDEVYGGIVLYYPETRHFSQEELQLAVSFGNQAALAIENSRLFHQAEQAATLEERQRLARELHDSVTQSLYGVTMYAEATARLLSGGNIELATEHMRAVRATAQEALQEMRLLLFELRPPILEQEGLAAALQARIDTVEGRAGVQTTLKIGEIPPLPPDVEQGLYRIAQEALNNVLKHAQAHEVAVELSRQNGQVVLEITDDGHGFDTIMARQNGGLGLHTMTERASQIGGQLSILTAPGAGTRIRVEVDTHQEKIL